MPASTRRFLPQTIVILVLVLAIALAAGAAAIAMGLPGRTAGKAPTTVLHWANEGISDLSTLDPAPGPDFNARQAQQLIYEGLVRVAAQSGAKYRILPGVASRWSVSRDGRSYTFYLRRNVRFGDGTLLTAAHVAFSLNRTLGPQFKDRSGPFLLGDIEGAADVTAGKALQARGIQVLDAHTLRIQLERPNGSFLAKLATPAGYIVPSWRVRANPKNWDEHAFGTGPFMVSRWVHRDRLLLAPNPHYWDGNLQINGIDMPFIPEPLTAYKRYRAGSLDIQGIVHFAPEALYEAEGLPDFHRSVRLETVFLTLNEQRPPFNKTRVRQAFSRAVDTAALVRTVYGKFAHPTNGMLPPGIVGYNPNLPGTGFDPRKARALLAEAGYPGGRGLPPVSYAVDQDAQSINLASALAEQWRRVLGVNVRINQAPTHTAYTDLLTRLDYQVAVIDWTADFPDPSNFLSQQFRTGSPNNNGGWSNRTFDRLVARADSMTPQENPKRLALYHRAEDIAMAEAAAIPLANPYAGILLRPGIEGFQISGGQLLASDWTQVKVNRDGDR